MVIWLMDESIFEFDNSDYNRKEAISSLSRMIRSVEKKTINFADYASRNYFSKREVFFIKKTVLDGYWKPGAGVRIVIRPQ